MLNTFTIRAPDDLHAHLRDGKMLEQVAGLHSDFARVLVMPNVPAIETASRALEYKEEICRASEPFEFTPLLSIKLTHRTTSEMIREAREVGVVSAKLYPFGATTASHDGVGDVRELAPIFFAMQQCGMVLCIHAEDPSRFVMDREAAYLDRVHWIVRNFPGLRVVIEHITTEVAVRFVQEQSVNVAATITAHHLIHTLDDVLGNGIKPHNYCKPISKRPEDRGALIDAALYQNGGRFFLGTDSAPHRAADKESACGCAGVFSAPVAMPILADVFIRDDDRDTAAKYRVDMLQAFTSERGADFYGLSRNTGAITLKREPWVVPDKYGDVVPLKAGETLAWKVVEWSHR